MINLGKPSWQDGKSKNLGWHVSHLSPTTLGLQPSHFIPVYPSLQEHLPLSSWQSKEVEPLMLQIHSEMENKDWFLYEKRNLERLTLTQWIVEISWFAFITIVTGDIFFALITFDTGKSFLTLITFATIKSMFTNAIPIGIAIQNRTIRSTITLWREVHFAPFDKICIGGLLTYAGGEIVMSG